MAIVLETSPDEFCLNTPPRDANALERDDTMVIDTRKPELSKLDTVGLRNMATGLPGGASSALAGSFPMRFWPILAEAAALPARRRPFHFIQVQEGK